MSDFRIANILLMHIPSIFRSIRSNIVLFAISILLSIPQAFGVNEIYEDHKKISDVSSSIFELQDNQFDLNTSQFKKQFLIRKVYNSVGIKINYENPSALKNGVTLTVNLNIKYWKWNGSSFEQLTKNATLDLNYTNDANISKDIDFIRFEGGHRVEVTIQNPSSSYPSCVELIGNIEVDRIYNLDAGPISPNKLRHEDKVNDRGELMVSWEPIDGAEAYDLEWTYVSNYSDKEDQRLAMQNVSLPENFFKYNSTRVSVSSNSYSIPLIYESGFILYRLRAVGKYYDLSTDTPLYGAWSSDDNKSETVKDFFDKTNQGHVFKFSGHESSINWQNRVNYAEEGKQKAIVSYFDGSYRNRQTVTKINTNDQALIGETIYDHAGRPAVTVLPVPTNQPKIQYYPNFNLSDKDQKPYNFTGFELDKNGNLCTISADPMSTASGASNYYSPLNGNQNGQQAYLPDANKYPFSQIEYTPDNTGRIRRQGGVGTIDQLGSGHEVKYIYTKPDQEELDKLFGAEAGYAIHYQKKTVVDANGQVSVTYINSKGQVIATALKGTSPDNLEALPSNKPEDVNVNLLGDKNSNFPYGQNNNVIIKDDYASLNLFQEQEVGTAGKKSFNYSLNLSPFKYQPCNDPSAPLLVKDVALDLEISYSDECGNQYLQDNTGNGTIVKQNLKSSGGSNLSYQGNWSTPRLNVNSYSLSKKLKINKSYLDQITNEYINNTSCIKTLQGFVDDAFKNLDPDNCANNCQSCLDLLKKEFPVKPSVGDHNYHKYILRRNECSAYCGSNSDKCASALEAMLADVSPHGQYGLLREDNPQAKEDGTINVNGQLNLNSKFNPSKYPLSIFNESNVLPRYKLKRGSNGFDQFLVTPYYRNPVDDNGNPSTYKNPDGSDVQILVTTVVKKDANNNTYVQFVPDVRPEVATAHVNDKTFLVAPQDLTLEDFVMNWQPNWAYSVVFYHPEFPVYQNCVDHSVVQEFLDDFMSTATLSEAVAKGFVINKSTTSGIIHGVTNLDADPFFDLNNTSVSFDWVNSFFEARSLFDILTNKPNPKKFFRTEAEAYMNAFTEGQYTLWETANMLVNCPKAARNIQCPAVPNCPSGSFIDNDEVWKKYKTLYISFRQTFEDQYQQLAALKRGSSNSCIGNDSYTTSNVPGYQDVDGLGGSSWGYLFGYNYYYLNVYQPCGLYNYSFYQDKTPRFPINKGASDKDDIKENYCYNNNLQGIINVNTCPQNDQQITDRLVQRYRLDLYKSCGQCPLVKDLELFLNAVAVNPIYNLDSDFKIGCFPSSNIPEVTELLLTSLGFDHIGELSWHVESEQDNTLTASLINANIDNKSCKFTFKLPATFDFSRINKISELHYNSHPQFFSPGPNDLGKTFIFKATFDDNSFVYGEGFTECLHLDTCTFEPLCFGTKEGYHFLNLLNGIAADLNGTDQLIKNVDLTSNPYTSFVTPQLLKAMFMTFASSYQPKLSSDHNTLDIKIHGGTNTFPQDVFISLTREETDYEFTDIKSFDVIHRDIHSNSSVNFLINVQVEKEVNGKKNVEIRTIKGFSAQLKMQECTDRIEVRSGSN